MSFPLVFSFALLAEQLTGISLKATNPFQNEFSSSFGVDSVYTYICMKYVCPYVYIYRDISMHSQITEGTTMCALLKIKTRGGSSHQWEG